MSTDSLFDDLQRSFTKVSDDLSSFSYELDRFVYDFKSAWNDERGEKIADDIQDSIESAMLSSFGSTSLSLGNGLLSYNEPKALQNALERAEEILGK